MSPTKLTAADQTMIPGERFRFKQDEASCHTGRLIKTHLQKENYHLD